MPQERHHASQLTRVADIGRANLPTGGPGSELAAILGSCNDRLHRLQLRAADIVFAELAVVQSAWLRAVTATEMSPCETDRQNTAHLVEIVSEWFQTIARTQTALIELVGRSALPAAPALANAFSATPPLPERRQRAIIINFPDRRRIKVA